MRKQQGTGIAVVMLALALTGCGPEGPNKADTGLAVGAVAGGILGSTVGRGSGRIAGAMIGTVVGGIVGSEIGRSMDRRDRILAERAEYDAFERGPSGSPRPLAEPGQRPLWRHRPNRILSPR